MTQITNNGELSNFQLNINIYTTVDSDETTTKIKIISMVIFNISLKLKLFHIIWKLWLTVSTMEINKNENTNRFHKRLFLVKNEHCIIIEWLLKHTISFIFSICLLISTLNSKQISQLNAFQYILLENNTYILEEKKKTWKQ